MNSLIIRTMDDAERAARAMSASGFFPDARQMAQAVVKILAGQELGFGPFASMQGVNIIQNRPAIAANLIAAGIKRSGKYDYRVIEHTTEVCSIDFYQDGQKVGNSTYRIQEAMNAGLTTKDNWKKYPKNMLFARAISNGQKWFCPDAFGGSPVYTPDELGAVEDEEGHIVTIPASENGQEGEQVESTEEPNPSPIPEKLMDAWVKLTERAAAVNIPFPQIDANRTTAEELKAAGKELRALVEGAEAQAKAEAGSQE